MKMLKTAFLSLFSHRAKTIVLMVVLSFGAFLTLTGLSFMYTFTENLRTGLTEAVTGDVVVHTKDTKGLVDIVIPFQEIEPMENYGAITEILKQNNEIEAMTPLSKDAVLILDPDTDEFETGLPVIGADINEFMRIFRKTEFSAKVEDEETISLTKRYVSELPEKLPVIFFETIPDEDKQKLLDSIREKKENTLKDMKPEEQIDSLAFLLTEDERKEYFNTFSKEQKETFILDYYKKFFKNVNLVDKIETYNKPAFEEGRSGVLVSQRFMEEVLKPNRVRSAKINRKMLKIGDNLSITSFTKKGSFSIIEIQIIGIISIPGSDLSILNNIMDLKTFQKIVGYDPESKIMSLEQLEAMERNKKYLEAENLDELRDENIDDLLSGDLGEWNEESETETNTEEETVVNEELQKRLEEQNKNVGSGKTQFITARLKNPYKMYQVIAELNKVFAEKNMNVIAVDYVASSGTFGGFIFLIGILVSAAIIIIQVISLIIITNSVLMGVLDRVNEIGTMRAIGAQRSYVFGLILSESFILSIISSIIGILLSLLGLWIFGLFGFGSPNFIAAVLFGGEKLIPQTHIVYIITTAIVIILTAFIATLYPVRIATKISPLEAMNKI